MAVRWIAVALLVSLISVEGCARKTTKPGPRDTSVSSLVKNLPNLNRFEVESCSFVVNTETSRSAVPSPSDTRTELQGSAVLSEAAAQNMRSDSSWKPVERSKIPTSLSAIVPSGDLLTSEPFNATFSNNPFFWHGYAVVLRGGNSRQVYFVATDKDHPIN